jgi:tryptophanyl-tRNA synthetase
MREKYESLMSKPAQIEAILLKGADKARQTATPLMQSLRQAVGLRGLGGLQPATKAEKKVAKTDAASFKQYRESDGKFYFKLVDAQAKVLLQSHGFDSPKEAAAAISSIKGAGIDAMPQLSKWLHPVEDYNLQQIVKVLQQIV